MSMRKVAALTLGLVLCCATLPASAKEVVVGRWRILSGKSSAGGTYCTMQLGDEVKGVGMQVMSDGDIFLSVANPAWKFETKKSYPISYAVDGSATWEGDAFAALPTILVIALTKTTDPLGTLAKGKSFVATVGGKALPFDLSGAPAARDALKKCLATKDF